MGVFLGHSWQDVAEPLQTWACHQITTQLILTIAVLKRILW